MNTWTRFEEGNLANQVAGSPEEVVSNQTIVVKQSMLSSNVCSSCDSKW